MRTRLHPALGVFAGGVIYAVIPRGAFGAYDVIARATVTAAAAAVTCLLLFARGERSRRSVG